MIGRGVGEKAGRREVVAGLDRAVGRAIGA
jgi:hypothetical protein